MIDGRPMSEETKMDKTFRTRLTLLVAAMAMATALFAAMVSSAQAEEPAINDLEFVPSSTQAGGHPDVFFRAHVEHVVQPRSRWRRRSLPHTPALP